MVPSRSIRRARSRVAVISSSGVPAAVAATVLRMPPPFSAISSYEAPAARSAYSSDRSPSQTRWVWASTKPGITAAPWASTSIVSAPVATSRPDAGPA